MQIQFAASISGMQSASVRHDITAHDVANVNTPGFSQQTPSQIELSPSGTAIGSISRTPNASSAFSNTDLATETGEQITNRNTFGANAKVIRTQNEMLGTLLDIVS